VTYALLADVVLSLHVAFLLLVTVGGLLLLRWPRLVWIHVPAVLRGGLVGMAGWICPLTPLAVRFRQLAGQAGYEGGFISHYILPVLYPAGLTREIQIGLGVGVIVLNVGIYWVVWRRWRRNDGVPAGRPVSP